MDTEIDATFAQLAGILRGELANFAGGLRGHGRARKSVLNQLMARLWTWGTEIHASAAAVDEDVWEEWWLLTQAVVNLRGALWGQARGFDRDWVLHRLNTAEAFMGDDSARSGAGEEDGKD